MSSAQDATFSPHNLAVLGGLLFIAVILGEVVFPRHGDEAVVTAKVDTVEDIAMRLQPVVVLDEMSKSPMGSGAGADTAAMTPNQLYDAACQACHTTGAAGAPKIGDAAAWKERASKGLEALVASAITGMGAMPPRGASQFDDEQMTAVIEYILAESK